MSSEIENLTEDFKEKSETDMEFVQKFTPPDFQAKNFRAKIGILDQKPKFWAQKKVPLSQIHHVLATTGKTCSKKKSAFAQIIKGGNIILGDFLG